MKRNYKVAAIFVAMLVCALSFAGCGEEAENLSSASSAVSDAAGSADSENNSDTDNSEASESDSSDNSEITDPDASYDESLHDLSSEESSEEESIDESQNSENASKAQSPNGESKTSGNTEFDALFVNNKLDADCKAESKNAETTEDMVSTMMKYKDFWVAETENANSQLQGSSLSDEEKQSIQNDYDEWSAGLDAKRQEIIAEEKKNWDGGSIYKVNAAEKFMNYCRDYAMELYKKMYEANGTFEMAYK